MYSAEERRYLDTARVGRLATADGDGRPHAVPVCFVPVDDWIATPIDEKPKEADPTALRRVRNVRENPRATLLVDHWTEAWEALGWVQVRGTAELVSPGGSGHDDAVDALRGKYEQYAAHALESRPMLRIRPGRVVSWGSLDRQV